MNASHLKAILFDMDGTLIHHTWDRDALNTAWFETFAPELHPITQAQFFSILRPKSADLWYMMVDGVLDGAIAQRYNYINTLRALNQPTEPADRMLARWRELVLQEAQPFPDTFAVLQQLRGQFTTGIITNGYTTMQQMKIDAFNLAPAVDFYLISESVGAHKPNPAIFQHALSLAGNIAPNEAVFIGDNLKTDIAGALAAGLQPILIDPAGKHTAPSGVPVIAGLSQLLTVLNLK